jgi:hypothetical protein
MPYSINTKWPSGVLRGRLFALATFVSGALLAGCGGSSSSPIASTVSGARTSVSAPASGAGSGSSITPRTGATGTSSSAPAGGGSGPIAFAKCMRANGVPNFPDPNPSGDFELGSAGGLGPSSPAFTAAQAKCQKFMGTPCGLGGSSVSPQVKAQSLAKLRGIAVCMRAHGVSQFPDPSPRPVQPGRLRYPRADRFRRCVPCLPEHPQPTGAGLQTGPGCVRRTATRPSPLIGTRRYRVGGKGRESRGGFR